MNLPFLTIACPGKLQRGKFPAGFITTRTSGLDDGLVGVNGWFATEADALATIGQPGQQIRSCDGLGGISAVMHWWAYTGWESAAGATPWVWKLRKLGSMPFATEYEVKIWLGPLRREIIFSFFNTPAVDTIGVFKQDTPRERIIRTVFLDQGSEFLNAAKVNSLLVATLQAELPEFVVTQNATHTNLTGYAGAWMVPRAQFASWECQFGRLPDQALRGRVLRLDWTGYQHSLPGNTTLVFPKAGFGLVLRNSGGGAPGDPIVQTPNTTFGIELLADWVFDIDFVPFAFVQMFPVAGMGFSYNGVTTGYIHLWDEKGELPIISGVNQANMILTDNFQTFSNQV